jgi:tripartite-type tricarboxylate transporter receptor subunit TctC
MWLSTIGRIAGAAALLLSMQIAATAADDANYPNRPVRMLAASAAGGNPDVIARLLSAKLSEVFNNPFVVEDVPGVGGVLAANQTVEAPPDGYTLSLNDTGALAINLAMNPEVKYKLKDFTPITALATLPTVLVVKPAVPANTLAEFVALAKSKPGMMTFGSAGSGSIHQMTMVIFEQQAGIQLLHVPYRGGTGLVNALLTGEVDSGWSGISNVLSLIQTGKLRALCLSVLERDVSLPDVPTCAELGYKGFDVATMLGLQSSAGVPPAIVCSRPSRKCCVRRTWPIG